MPKCPQAAICRMAFVIESNAFFIADLCFIGYEISRRKDESVTLRCPSNEDFANDKPELPHTITWRRCGKCSGHWPVLVYIYIQFGSLEDITYGELFPTGRASFNLTTGALTINSLQYNDSADYQCVSMLRNRKFTTSRLRVQGKGVSYS